MRVCFHLDHRYRDLWAHLVLTYRLGCVYEVGAPEDEGTPRWLPVASIDDVPGPRVFFAARDAKLTPGTVPLADYEPGPDDVLMFGVDDFHNRYELREQEPVVYFATPGPTPLHAVQAAAVVLQALWERRHG